MKTSYRTFPKRAASVFLCACAMTLFSNIQNLQAQEFPQRGPIPFHMYDIDANGFIAPDEFHTMHSQRMARKAAQGYPMRGAASTANFIQFDTNQDGQLSPDELAFGQQRQMQKRWDMRQSQGMRQGKGGAANQPQFEDFDRNKDGLLTPEEFVWGQQQQMQKRWDMMRQNQSMGMGMRQGQGRGMGRGRNMPSFADFDGNKDGYISEQELIEARSMRISQRIQQGYQMKNIANAPQFQEIDQNSDAKISPEEFSELQRQHQMQRPQ